MERRVRLLCDILKEEAIGMACAMRRHNAEMGHNTSGMIILQNVLEDWTSMRYDLPLERTAAVVHAQAVLMTSSMLHKWKGKLANYSEYRELYNHVRFELRDVKMALDLREDIWEIGGYNWPSLRQPWGTGAIACPAHVCQLPVLFSVPGCLCADPARARGWATVPSMRHHIDAHLAGTVAGDVCHFGCTLGNLACRSCSDEIVDAGKCQNVLFLISIASYNPGSALAILYPPISQMSSRRSNAIFTSLSSKRT